MKLCIVLGTEETDGLVFELEPSSRADESGAELTVSHFVGRFPLPGAMVAAMIGTDAGAEEAIDVNSWPTADRPGWPTAGLV